MLHPINTNLLDQVIELADDNRGSLGFIPSARDVAQRVTLNPFGHPDRFNRVRYQADTNVQMTEQLSPDNPPHTEATKLPREQRVVEKEQQIHLQAAANRQQQTRSPEQLQRKEVWLEEKVTQINRKRSDHLQLDPQLVKDAARERDFDEIFYRRLTQLERNTERGIFTPEPYAYLQSGRVQRGDTLYPAPPRQAAAEALAAAPDPVLVPLPTPAAAATTSPPASAEVLPARDVAAPVAAAVEAPPQTPARPPDKVPGLISRTAPTAGTPLLQEAVVESAPPVTAPVLRATEPDAPVPAGSPASISEPRPSALVAGELRAPLPPAPPVPQQAGQQREEAQGQETNAAARNARLALQQQLAERVAAAAERAQRTGAAFAFLLELTGGELVVQPDGALAGVRDKASGELFTPGQVPLPGGAQDAGSPRVQYGLIQAAAYEGASAEERLAIHRAELAAAGITAGPAEPATATRPAQLRYCFAADQLHQDEVARRLNAIQAQPKTCVREAPHCWRTADAPAVGLAGPPTQWPEREGQFTQALLVFDLTDPQSTRLADRARQQLLESHVAVSPVTADGHGHLELHVHYHTHGPESVGIRATLDGAQNEGVEVRQSGQAAQAHLALVFERYMQGDKQAENSTGISY